MPNQEKLIRFEWVLKYMLRNKANFDIVEGFLTALLKEEIQIIEILESESNQEENKKKFNRVDILVKDAEGKRIVVEIQNEYELNYLERLLFGTSKVITETIELGNKFRDVKKVISVSIQQFNLGYGKDYIYYGTTEFVGLTTGEKLVVRERIETELGVILKEKKNIFPEYYLINVPRFRGVVKEDIDEWIYFLKNSEIKEQFKSKNIQKAAKKLNVLYMDKKERKLYEKYLMDLASEQGTIDNAKLEGKEEGIKEGIKKGIEKGKEEGIKEGIEKVARNLLDILDDATIAQKTRLKVEDIAKLREKY